MIQKYAKNSINTSILWKLRTGRAYTAIELAKEIKISKDDIHSCLTKLIQDNLLVEIERRKRGYYRLLNDNVKQALHRYYIKTGVTESELEENHHPTGMKYCRTCYNHLAGKVGVMLTDRLRQKQYIRIGTDTHFELTPEGLSFFKEFGIDTEELQKKRSQFAKACIDFSERKYHLGGSLGKALFDQLESNGWVQRIVANREVKITPKGKKAFADRFQVHT